MWYYTNVSEDYAASIFRVFWNVGHNQKTSGLIWNWLVLNWFTWSKYKSKIN